MRLLCEELRGRSGHETAYGLLERLYREQTGDPLPEIRRTDRGKPYFPEGGWHFSLSHTKRRAFCVLSRHNVAIDAEELDRQIDLRLAEKILSPGEKRQFEAAAGPKRKKNSGYLAVPGEAYFFGVIASYPRSIHFRTVPVVFMGSTSLSVRFEIDGGEIY